MPLIPSTLTTVGYLSTCLLCLALLGVTIWKNHKSPIHQSYFSLLLGYFLWIGTLYLYLYVDLGSHLLFWGRMNYATGVFIPVGLTLFFYYFPRKTIHLPAWATGGYLMYSAFLFYICLFTDWIDKDEVYTEFGPWVTLGEHYYLYSWHIVSSLAFAGFFGIQKLVSLRGLEKAQMLYAFFIFIPTAGVTYTLATILPIFEMYGQFDYMFITAIPIAAASFYAIHRYRFFNFSFLFLNVFRHLILTTASGVTGFLVHTFFFPESVTINVIASILAGIYAFAKLTKVFPEFVSSGFREFRNTLSELRSKLYHCQRYNQLKKLLDDTFVLRLQTANARVFIIRGKNEKANIPYCTDEALVSALEQKKGVLVVDEIAVQKDTLHLRESFEELDATVCFPLFAEDKIIGIFTLGSKSNDHLYSQEEIQEISGVVKDIEVAFLNIILKLNLEQENNMMKSIIEQKTQDIKRQYEKVKEMLEQQSDFIAVTAHEFRTPLSIAMFQLRDILKSYEQTAATVERSDVETVQESLQNLNTLTNKMFEVQQYDLNKVDLETENISIGNFAKDIFEEFTPIVKEKKIQFSFESKVDKEVVLAIDPYQIRQVLHNLLMNAKKFTPEKGKITFIADIREGNVIFCVTDNGAGISDKMKKQVFEKFRTQHVTQGTGIGLGLYLCKKIMELHKGKIWVEDTPKQGSTFCVSFPKSLIQS